MASTKLRRIIKENSWGINGDVKMSGIKRKVNPNIKARTRLEAGPARATLAGPYFLSLKLLGLYGTGLA